MPFLKGKDICTTDAEELLMWVIAHKVQERDQQTESLFGEETVTARLGIRAGAQKLKFPSRIPFGTREGKEKLLLLVVLRLTFVLCLILLILLMLVLRVVRVRPTLVGIVRIMLRIVFWISLCLFHWETPSTIRAASVNKRSRNLLPRPTRRA
jgi:hypothetical protein